MTTLSSASGTATVKSYSSPAQARRSRALPIAIFLAVAVVAAAAWVVMGLRSAMTDPTAIERYAVTPHTFTVMLQEKGELKAAKSTEITCEVEGRSTIISLVPEGTAVKQGDVLVELASDQIEDSIRQEELKEANAITAFEAAKTELDIQRDRNASDIRKAQLEIELRTLDLDKYTEGDWVQRLTDADVAIEQAQINLKRRNDDFDASEKLFANDYITKSEFEEDSFNFKKAQWDLEKANLAKSVLQQYTHVADLKQRESDVAEATKEAERVKKNADAEEIKKLRDVEGKQKELELIQDQLVKLRRQKDNCVIKAPTQGIVVYYAGDGGRHFMSNDSQIREGATVFERQVILTLPDTSEMLVVVRVHEAKTNRLSLQQPVRVTVEGLPGKVFNGKVTKIAAVADSQNRWLNPDLKEYETEITLDATDVPLKPGVTAHADILVETVEDDLAVPVQAVYSKDGRRYVFRSDRKNKVEPVQVTLGAIGTEWAQIRDGLAPNDSVLLAFGDEHKRMIPDLPSPGRPDGMAPGMRGGPPSGGSADRRPAGMQRKGKGKPQGGRETADQGQRDGGHAPGGQKAGSASP